jgi:hypothetical protein
VNRKDAKDAKRAKKEGFFVGLIAELLNHEGSKGAKRVFVSYEPLRR